MYYILFKNSTVYPLGQQKPESQENETVWMFETFNEYINEFRKLRKRRWKIQYP
jgi:hypothetical protein